MPESLISIARTDREKEKMLSPAPDPLAIPDYDWGTSITLGPRELRKLGYADGIEAGGDVAVLAVAVVTNNSVEVIEGRKDYTVTLQFKALKVEPFTDRETPEGAELIYGGKVARS